MNRKVIEKILIAMLLGCLLYIGYFLKTEMELAPARRLTALLASVGAFANIDPQKESDCHIAGPLPDADCTPGAVFPEATKEIICVSGYTKTVRNVSTATRKKVFAEYGIEYPQPRGSYEVDHLIPLELGGSNEIANLFPEAAQPAPGFKEKDVVENYLHQEVCAGHIELGAAQAQIASNWLAVYNVLTPDQIQQLKSQFASWAD